MIAAERKEAILRELRLRGSLAVAEFSDRIGISPITLRRDLADLEQAGRLTRVHGGATSVRPAHVESRGTRSTQQLAAAFGLAPRGPSGATTVATIGMIVPTRRYYYASIIEGAQSAAKLADVRLILAISEYDEVEERRMFERMLSLGLDGILITPSRSTLADNPLRELIERARIPVTVLERVWDFPVRGRVVDSVRSDHSYGGALGARHLAELGHRRIALWSFANPHVEEITAGFTTAAAEAGCEVHRSSFDFGHPDWSEDDAMRNVRRYVDEALGTGVTGLVVHPDEVAMQVMGAALDRGVDVPRELSIIAYDDEVASLGELPLTAISPPKRAIGFAAIDACLRAVAHAGPGVEDFPAQRIRLLPTLRERESSGPPPDRTIA